MGLRYSGLNLDQCLNKAEKELSLPKDKIKYTIVNERKNIFGKHCEILVFEDVSTEESNSVNKVEINESAIILNNNLQKELKLDFCEEDIEITVNGQVAKKGDKVSNKDIIRYKCKKIEGKRKLNISTTDLEARISIDYESELVGEASCEILNNSILHINVKLVKGETIPYYSKDEIIEILSEHNIIFGLDYEAIEKAIEKDEVNNVVVARGIAPIDDEDDVIKVFFESMVNNLDESKKDRIDYKSIKSITNVSINTELGERLVGAEGRNGISIKGNVINRKLKKNLQLKVGSGCKIIGDKVISIIEGNPSIKSGVFYVHKVFETEDEVDIKSGNIKFIGDVKVGSNVKEGMVVEAGNSLIIEGNVEMAKVIAHGDSVINGSIIGSLINIGAEDIINQKKLEDLQEFSHEVDLLIAAIIEVKERNILQNINDGQLIKALIDNKCKDILKKSIKVLKYSGTNNLENIKNIIREKIIGFGPLKIKFWNELYTLQEKLKLEIEPLKERLFVPVDLYSNYIQDSNISVTGNIYINGKGQYTSKISALGDIIFTKDNAVSRGGELKAKGNIKAKVLGSTAGVSTVLKVSKDSVITADIAYNNTIFFFGEKKYVLESSSRDLKAYLNEKGEIIVEKFML